MLMYGLLLTGAQRHPDKTAFHWVDRKRSLTYAQAALQMDHMAGALHSLGVGRGDRVTVFAHNGLDYLTTMFGCWRIGAIVALVNVKFVDELDYYLADHEPKAIVYTHDMGAAVRKAAAGVLSVKHLICMDGPQEGAHSLPELMAARLPAPPDMADETAIAHLSYTSGTSGKPKGACLCHEPTVRATRCIAERLRITGDDISFGPTALSSSYQLVGNLLPPLAHGCTIHVMGRWTQTTGWDAIDAAGASTFIANPTLLQELLAKVEDARTPARPAALRHVGRRPGAADPQVRIARRAQAAPGGELWPERAGRLRRARLSGARTRRRQAAAIGPALPDKEVRIFAAGDREQGVGEIGEMVLRGGFMWGYWNKAEKTKETLRGGWLHTGDAGFVDRDGFITMRGRYSELITVSGKQWFPRDVEEALCRIAGVRQAALVGVPDAKLGQKPVAFVTLDDLGLKADALKRGIVGEVAYDLAPLEVKIVSELPMTPTGKISKGQLLTQIQAGAV